MFDSFGISEIKPAVELVGVFNISSPPEFAYYGIAYFLETPAWPSWLRANLSINANTYATWRISKLPVKHRSVGYCFGCAFQSSTDWGTTYLQFNPGRTGHKLGYVSPDCDQKRSKLDNSFKRHLYTLHRTALQKERLIMKTWLPYHILFRRGSTLRPYRLL